MDEILPNTGMELPDIGSDQDTWGNILNANLRILDNAITYDAVAKTLSAVDVTLTTAEAAHGVINLTGALTANVSLIVPVSPVRLYLVNNGTTGAFSVTVKTPAGTGVTVLQGANSLVYSNGTNIVQGARSINGTFAVSGALTAGSATVTGALTANGVGNKLSVSGAGSTLAISPATLGTINNASVGATTPSTGSFTNLAYTGTFTGGTGEINIGSGQFYKSAVGAFGFGTTSTLGFRGVFAESAGNSLALLKPTATLPTESVRLRYYSANTNDGGTYDLGGVDCLREDGGFGVRSSMVVNVKRSGGAGNLFTAGRFTHSGYLKASNTGSYPNVNDSFHELANDADTAVVVASSTNTGSATNVYNSQLPAGAAGFHAQYSTNASVVYQVLANGNVQNTNNSYGAISDAKFKENIVDATSHLERFMQVRFRKYNMIGDTLTQFGVVAQELESIFPGLVDTTPDFEQVGVLDEETGETRTESVALGTVTKSVKYSVLAAIQGKVIQEQQQIIQAQQAQIESILTRVAALEGRLNG